MTMRSEGLSRNPLLLDHISLPSGVKYASWTSWTFTFVICLVVVSMLTTIIVSVLKVFSFGR